MREKSLKEAPWEGLLAEHLYERAPLDEGRVPELGPYEVAARDYLKEFPKAVPDAIEAAVSQWDDREAPIEQVLNLLRPPLLEWARSKGMKLNDHPASLYKMASS